MMVAIAAQRNQNSAAGAITLVIAGFSGSGIFGMDGVCTKLKYQRRPIHITPDMTCSQRMAKSHQACSPIGTRAPTATRMMSSTMSTTTPAVMVRPSDWKNAPICFSFSFGVASEKSLAPSPRAGQTATRGDDEDHELRDHERGLQPVALAHDLGQDTCVADRRDEREQRDGAQVQHIPVAEEMQPGPAVRHVRNGD